MENFKASSRRIQASTISVPGVPEQTMTLLFTSISEEYQNTQYNAYIRIDVHSLLRF